MAEIFDPAAWKALFPWIPLIFSGFLLNILISIVSMSAGMLIGALLGIVQSSTFAWVRFIASCVSLLLRNSPWLVILFFAMYFIPVNIVMLGNYIFVPVWMKAAIALSLPAAGFFSEIVRGGIAFIPRTQWEAAESLGFGFWRTISFIILPQALRRMIPPTINLYCAIALGTSLATVVGAQESISTVQIILNTVRVPGIMFTSYGFILFLFFLYIFPISLASRRMERALDRQQGGKG